MNKKLIRLLVYVGAIGLGLFFLIFITTSTLIGFDVKQRCDNAKQKYKGNCVEVLIQTLNDESNSFKDRNYAIWALGQLGDKKANTVLKKYRTITSQYKLKDLVTKELDTKKDKYGVSSSRLRHLAINSDFIKLEIHSREGDPKKLMNKCPVCLAKLKRVKNLTIWGGEVTIEYKCAKCGYWTGKKKRIPKRYVFHLKKK